MAGQIEWLQYRDHTASKASNIHSLALPRKRMLSLGLEEHTGAWTSFSDHMSRAEGPLQPSNLPHFLKGALNLDAEFWMLHTIRRGGHLHYIALALTSLEAAASASDPELKV